MLNMEHIRASPAVLCGYCKLLPVIIFCVFQNSVKSKKVLLVISLSGIKVCSSDGEVIFN